MILDCTQCHARFLVADAMIPPAGRMVRCGKCAHQWFVHHPDPEVAANFAALMAQEAAMPEPAAPPEITPLAKGANVPAIKKQRRNLNPLPFKLAAPLIAIAWLGLAFIAYFPHWMQSSTMASIYAAAGIESTDGLIFSDITMEREQEGSKTKFIIAGSVRNHASGTRQLPAIRVTMKDKSGKAVWGREYPIKDPDKGTNILLKAGDIYPFRINNVETSFASSVSSIVLDLGHPLELMMR